MGITYLSKSLGSWVTNKAVLFCVAALALVLFGDALLTLIGHLAFLLLEAVEEALDVLLESAFALTPRSAQMTVAWTAMALLVIGLFWAIHKIQSIVQNELMPKLYLWREQLQTSPWSAWLSYPWVKPVALVVVLGASLLLFF